MSVVQSNFQNRVFFIALTTAASLAASATSLSVAAAAPAAVSMRVEQRAAKPTTAGIAPNSQITRSKSLQLAQALKRAQSAPASTNPADQKSAASAPATVMVPVAVVVAAPSANTVAAPTQATITDTNGSTLSAKKPVATPTPPASLSGSPVLTATIKKPLDSKAEADRVLLATLDADLNKTQTRLTSTSQKLSAGQRQLMSLSNTMRSAIIEAGGDGAGLHPFVRIASRYAGTPYVWGGESRYGFDCSGFIIRVMRDLGYKALPHSAAEQFKYGKPVAQGLLKPGDIVFFANTYKPGISHVGIYIGKRRFIHAASTRQGTIVSSLDASPYRQKYAGARRLLTVRKKA